MKKMNLLSKAEMKKVLGGTEGDSMHYEPCNTHDDCTAHAPICMQTGTSIGAICCDVASMQKGGFCYNFGHHTD